MDAASTQVQACRINRPERGQTPRNSHGIRNECQLHKQDLKVNRCLLQSVSGECPGLCWPPEGFLNFPAVCLQHRVMKVCAEESCGGGKCPGQRETDPWLTHWNPAHSGKSVLQVPISGI